MNKKTNHYTLMFIPENNGKTFTLRVHKNIVHSLVAFFIVFIICLIMLLFKAGEIAVRLQMLYIVKIENEKLLIENKQLRQITDQFDKIEALYDYLNKLANPSIMTKDKTIKENDNESQVLINESLSQKTISITPRIKEELKSIPNIVPVDGWVTRQFSKIIDSSGTFHQGIDFAATFGSSIKATGPGIVIDIITDPYLGQLITIDHDNGYITKYGHCSQILISKNDRIKRGQIIALVGNTGRSTAPHLHYELLKDGVNIDPMKYIITYK